MMVNLLQESSATIEKLRVRLLLVRIFGMIRRQIFIAWQKAVEAKYARQIANATQAASYSIQQQADDITRPLEIPHSSVLSMVLSIGALALGDGVKPESPCETPPA